MTGSASGSGITAPGSATAVEAGERWAGTLVLPTSLTDIVVTFGKRGDAWTATLDVPAAHLKGLALADVTYTDDAIRFTLEKPAAPQATERYDFAREGDDARGTLAISGQSFQARLVKLAAGEAPKSTIARPQTPKPPFPYATRDVTIEAPEAGVLAGTLTLPAGQGPFPAVLLISGSGAQDRDETIFGHKPFAVIADALARSGIASLRTDDRGAGKTTGAPGSFDTETEDARAAFEWLAQQPEIDGKRVGLLGHSVGGIHAPRVAARTGRAAFVIAMAGPGVPGGELVALQIEAMMKAKNMPPQLIESSVTGQRKVAAAAQSADRAKVRAALAEVMAGAPDAMIEAKVAEVMAPWTLGFFRTDPAKAWQKVKAPVLAVIGEKDLQVPADLNLEKISAALAAGGNKHVKTVKRPGLNHLYQNATTGLVDEYATIEETFDPATLALVTSWISEQTKR